MFLPQGDALTMHYRGTLTNGKQFDASYDRGQPFKFQIGVGQVEAKVIVHRLASTCSISLTPISPEPSPR